LGWKETLQYFTAHRPNTTLPGTLCYS